MEDTEVCDTAPMREEYSITELTNIYLKWKGTDAVSWKLRDLSKEELLKMVEILNAHILIKDTELNRKTYKA